MIVKKLLEHGCSTEDVDIRKLSAQQSAINRGYIHCYEMIGKVEKFTAIKKLKMLTDSILVNKKIKHEQLKNLDKCFQKCYERYERYSQQILCKNEFTQNQTNLLQELQEQRQI